VAQFEVGKLAAAGVGGEAGEPVAANVGEAQPGAGWGRSLPTMTRIPSGQEARSASR
jgi:hypothetical protein